MRLEGIHHVTAITGDARANLAFYTDVMGLRLAAKTVNQDDPSVYHLFYSDEQGDAGSDITFFEYPGAVPGRHGAGMVHTVVWRVGSPEALDFWKSRLDGLAIATQRTEAGGLRFADPEGLGHELVVNMSGDDPLIADHPEVPREMALQGFEGVRAYTDDPERSRPLLERLMGGTPIRGAQATDDGTWELRGERRGGWIAYEPAPEAPGRQSAGSVHHVAWGTTVAEHPRWHERISGAGVPVTPIIDRHYFHSIYFREPSGVLFEIADDGPGFTVDVPLEDLGSKVILPPFLEPRREELEARLTPLPDPRADWPKTVAG